MSSDSRADIVERRLGEEGRRLVPPRGTRALTAILPNGRVLWLHVDRAVAPAATIGQLAQAAENTVQWRRATAESQSDAITRLSQKVAADAERVEDARLERVRRRRRRIVARKIRSSRKLARATEKYRSRVARQIRFEREIVRRLARRDLWDQIVIASAFPLFAAYGQRGRPLGANNVALTLSLLIWLVGDEIVEALFGSEDASPYPLRDTDAWSYIAPVGNLLAGWWLLDNQQHERFVLNRVAIEEMPFVATPNPAAPPGAPEIIYEYAAAIDLSRFVASSHFPDFQTFTGVPAVATIGAIRPPDTGEVGEPRVNGLRTEVLGGVLTIAFTAVAPDLRAAPADPIPSLVGEIAWMVDTDKPATTRSS